jgi:hypothetical protein
VAGNALLLEGDFVAWDEQELLPAAQQFGNFARIGARHEWGHAIQARAGFDTSQTIYLNSKPTACRCMDRPRRGGDAAVQMNDDDLDGARRAPPARDPRDRRSQDGAHGNGSDHRSPRTVTRRRQAAAYQTNRRDHRVRLHSEDYASGGDMSLPTCFPR